MPVAFDYDEISGFVRTTAQGVVTEEDWVRHVRALEHAGLLEVRQLLDARQLVLDASSDEVKRLASLVRTFRGRRGTVRTAFVATEPHVYGLARMYGVMTTDVDPGFAVFDDLVEAEAWLRGGGEGD